MMPKNQAIHRHLNLREGRVELTHGSGGKASIQLIEEIFAAHFTNPFLEEGHDGAFLPASSKPWVMSCDAHVVSPLFFKGGNIGDLAVCGTVNDVSVCGAKPLYMSASFIIEEGFLLSRLNEIVLSMARRAQEAGIVIVTGDTKVVEKGACDGLYISTSAIGERLTDQIVSGKKAQRGDKILISGRLGEHGLTVLSEREGLSFSTELASDVAPLNGLIAQLIEAVPNVHVLRDPTRGGLGCTLNEIAHQSEVGITLTEDALPIAPAVTAACEFLGLDPLYVANEGKVIVIVPPDDALDALEALRAHPYGRDAAIIGEVTHETPGLVKMNTQIGGTRCVDWLNAEQLPRIC